MKRSVVFAFAMIMTGASFSQKITGKITELVNGQPTPVAFANVFIAGETIGTTTDFDGNYTLSVKPGNYKLVVSFVGYLADTLAVNVGNQDVKLDVGLKQNSQTLKEFQVEAKVNRESETVLLMERMNAQGIEQNIGAKELSKTGSSNVASGLKKVAGISVVGSSDIFVRGMGDRYNLAYLNGMPTPSSNPNKKVMPLNIFPSSIVSSLNVKKAFTPDLYGDFSGGIIDIRTKDFPDGPTLDVTMGTGFNTQTTFKDFVTYQGGKTDYFGMDDGTRAVPIDLTELEYYNSSSELGEGTGFKNNFNPTMTTAPLNTKYQITGGNYWKLKKLKKSGVGVMLSAFHSVNSQNLPGTYRVINAQNDFQLDYEYTDYRINTNSSGLANVQFRLLEDHRISANMVMVNQ
ncbi:MAG: carboxypeptidase-like regulatory domain-containing protein, partial [Flavobacteriales bacterium]|nr:carboxypeptidase-like regulatory domain-containing protein [Flavobacteriales bacterium]